MRNILDKTDIGDKQKEQLRRVLNTAAQKAGDSFSMMIGDSVDAEIIDFYETPVELATKAQNSGEKAAIIYSELTESENGYALFSLSQESATKLSNILLMRDHDHVVEEFGEDEKDALSEIGNIVIGNFMSEIADFFNMEILFTPPQMIEEVHEEGYRKIIGDSINMDEFTLITDLRFKAKDVGIDSQNLIIPSDELMEKIIDFLN